MADFRNWFFSKFQIRERTIYIISIVIFSIPFKKLTGTPIENIIPPVGIRVISLTILICAVDMELANVA